MCNKGKVFTGNEYEPEIIMYYTGGKAGGGFTITKSRLKHEKETLHTMISIYCKGHKHGIPLCSHCQKLLDYASARLDACRFGNRKPFCSKCTIHCYEPEMRENIRKVMRYSGPRMIWRNPIIALKHFFQK
ncbi:MAG: nitrous oxide-stimulated promoter family protein [Clostridia bacterium]|nr:nitrous oxide-stimulated promoter family protein [Clostridia bacterium]